MSYFLTNLSQISNKEISRYIFSVIDEKNNCIIKKNN